jgi:hypothetical protein
VQVIKGVKKLLQVFVNEGYALNASIEPVQSSADNNGGKLRVVDSLGYCPLLGQSPMTCNF